MAQSFACLHTHVVFSTKNRERLLSKDVMPRLVAYIGGTARGEGSVLLAAGGVVDHVHLLIDQPRDAAIAELIAKIKASSSRWLKAEVGIRDFEWQRGYAAFAVSHSQLDAARRYIESQEARHRTKTFREEYIDLLELHGIEYDERYVMGD